MDIDARINEIEKLACQRGIMYKICLAAGLVLYASLFLAAFENHRLLAICVTFCLFVCVRLLLRAHAVLVERRVLREVRQVKGSLPEG
jgi:hypothetical protein